MSEAIQKIEKSKLPSIQELRNDESLTILGRENDLNVLLNEEPNPAWVIKNKFANNSLYVPIARLEWLMTRIFVNWYTEVLSVNLIANSIGVTVRVHYRNPVTGEMQWTDGVGASAMQVNEGKGATDFMELKKNAVEIGLPKAKTEAIKDAIGDLGRLFGRDLNRKDTPEYRSMLGQVEDCVSSEESATIEGLLSSLGEAYRAELLVFLGAEEVSEIKKSDFKKVISRITDRINHNGKTNSSHS